MTAPSTTMAWCIGRSSTRARIRGAKRAPSSSRAASVELHRDIEIEESGELRILVDQPKNERARRQMAQRLLARDEGIAAAALNERAAVKHVARSAKRHEFLVVPLLDQALHDDEQTFGRRSAREDGLVWAEIADIEL